MAGARISNRRLIALLILIALVLVGCGSADDGGESVGDGGAAAPEPGSAPGFVDEDGGGQTGGEAGGDGASGEGVVPGQIDAAGLEAIAASSLRKVIYDAQIDLTVEDTGDAVGSIRRLAASSGGFVSSTDLSEDANGRLHGTVVIRVPATGLDSTLGALRDLAVEEPIEKLTARDVTEEFIDLEAQLGNLRILEAELQELLADIRNASDRTPDQLFTVFERIRQVRNEIDALEGRLRVLDDQVALSTVTITLTPEVDPIAAVNEDPWAPGEIVREAWAALVSSIRVVANVAIWVAIFVIPVLLLLAAPFALAYVVQRRVRDRRTAPPTAPPPTPPPPPRHDPLTPPRRWHDLTTTVVTKSCHRRGRPQA